MGNRFFTIDSNKLKKAKKNANGFLVVPEVIIGKCGVFPYKNADGSIRYELRHPEDVLSKESLDTLKNVAVTFEHPLNNKGEYVPVTSQNAKELSKGLLGDAIEVENGSKIKGSLVVTHEDLINKIEKDGIREVSGGYFMDLEKESGVYKGQKYDFRQRNIRYNHLAITVKGRQGSDVAMRLDSDDAIETKLGENMEEIEIGGEKYEVASAVASHIKSLLEKAEKMKGEKEEVEQAKEQADSEKASVEEEKEKVEARADSLEQDLKLANDKIEELEKGQDDTARLDSLANERIEAMTIHKRLVRGDSANLKEMTNFDIKKDVVKACFPKLDVEGKSETYIQARFDSIIEKDETALERIEKELSTKGNSRGDSNDGEHGSEAARIRAAKEARELGRKPLTK